MPEHPAKGMVVNLMQGLELKVYQAKSYKNSPGRWHAHVVTPRGWPNYFDRLGIRWMPSPTPWTDASADTEEEVRAKACEIVGKLYGERLKDALQPYTPPQPATVYPPRELTF